MRTLLVAVANDPQSKLLFTWMIENAIQADDSLHILHVSMKAAADAALPGGDYFDQAHPAAAKQVVQEMLHTQFVAPLTAAFPHLQHVVHNVQAAQDCHTVGRIICEKAEQLQAEQVFVGGSAGHHSKLSALATMVSGSVVQYVKRHCKVPVTVVVQQRGSMTAEELAS